MTRRVVVQASHISQEQMSVFEREVGKSVLMQKCMCFSGYTVVDNRWARNYAESSLDLVPSAAKYPGITRSLSTLSS